MPPNKVTKVKPRKLGVLKISLPLSIEIGRNYNTDYSLEAHDKIPPTDGKGHNLPSFKNLGYNFLASFQQQL